MTESSMGGLCEVLVGALRQLWSWRLCWWKETGLPVFVGDVHVNSYRVSAKAFIIVPAFGGMNIGCSTALCPRGRRHFLLLCLDYVMTAMIWDKMLDKTDRVFNFITLVLGHKLLSASSWLSSRRVEFYLAWRAWLQRQASLREEKLSLLPGSYSRIHGEWCRDTLESVGLHLPGVLISEASFPEGQKAKFSAEHLQQQMHHRAVGYLWKKNPSTVVDEATG